MAMRHEVLGQKELEELSLKALKESKKETQICICSIGIISVILLIAIL